jgi:hypothetical protein
MSVVCVCAAAASAAPGPNDDYVIVSDTGSGGISSFGASADVEAQSGPTGRNPSGTFSAAEMWSVHTHSRIENATVTCLKVEGNKAMVGGYGTVTGWSDDLWDPDDPFKTGYYSTPTTFQLYVEDNTDRQHWEDPAWDGPFDMVEWGFSDAGPASCASVSPTMLSNGFELYIGNAVVHDAPSVPQTAAACKSGGYSAFGFKNQGQCVAFVQRGPKP